MTLTAAAVAPGGDFDMGWGRDFGAVAPFVYGDRVYFRWRYRFSAGTNGRYYTQFPDTFLASLGNTKMVLLNQGSSSVTSRVILDLQINNDPFNHQWGIQKGGGTDPDDTGTFPVDTTWRGVQLCVRYSSSIGATDGGYDVWVANATEGSPDATVSGIVVNADANPGNVRFHAYQNQGLYSDGVFAMDTVGFAISETFTAGWT